MLDDDWKKILRGCLVLVVLLVIQFFLIALACWLLCKCGNWHFRWVYPITANVLGILLFSGFKKN